MVPQGVKGKVKSIKEGEFTVEDTVCIVQGEDKEHEITMVQKWPVRVGRDYAKKNLIRMSL